MLLDTVQKNNYDHIPQYLGDIYYVSKDGNDSSDGKSPCNAFFTINKAVSMLTEGDSIRIKSGGYVENIDLNVDGCELIGAIGVSIIGKLTVSAKSCYVKDLTVIQVTATEAIVITGDVFSANRVNAMGSNYTIGFKSSGDRHNLVNCVAANYTSIGFKSSNIVNRYKDCLAQGHDTQTTGFYFTDDSDGSSCENCTSTQNSLNSYYNEENATDLLFINCHSGLGDGPRSGYFGKAMWSNYSYEDKKHATQVLNDTSASYIYTNLFKISGAVRILNIRGIIKQNMSSSIEDLYLELYSTNGSENITVDVNGRDLDNEIIGGILEVNNRPGVKIDFVSASGCNVDATTREQYYSFMCVADKTAGVQVDTYIRVGYKTSNTPSSGQIHWHVEWEKLSPDGFLTVA